MSTASAAEATRCLLELDVAGMRRVQDAMNPEYPSPGTDADVLAGLHSARTQLPTIPLDKRLYSHAWLTERGMPSQLPDDLKPKAARLYPHVVSAVGIMVAFGSEEMKPVALAVRGAMEDAVNEAYADGRGNDIPHVRARMQEARSRELRALIIKPARLRAGH